MAALYQNTDLASLLVGMVKSPSSIQDAKVTGLSLDSRQCEAGFLFIALAKEPSQRLSHIQQAVLAGATVVLIDSEQVLTADEEALFIESSAQAIAVGQLATKTGEIAARFYGHPSLALTVIAITGTNGKTSVSQFIAQCLEGLGKGCGVIGTLGAGRVGDLHDTGMTTPDPISIQRMLAEFCQQSLPYVVLEASSHALEQGRLNSVAIDVAVLTNLSRDHLDYHQDLASYAAAKQQLFDFASIKTAVINSADQFGQTLLASLTERDNVLLLTYNSEQPASVYAENIVSNVSGIEFTLKLDAASASVKSQLLGRFNVDNLLATAASLVALGMTAEQINESLTHCQAITGRMQSYGGDKQAHFVIDFAHTPDALTQALSSLRGHVPTDGELWCVFGCGGDRDTGKRALMGETAEHNADRVILTADNPRSEANTAIVADILKGIKQPEQIHIEHDRQRAINFAASHAKATDIVLVAGKGHELYQEVSGVKTPFSDEKAVIAALQAANDERALVNGAEQ